MATLKQATSVDLTGYTPMEKPANMSGHFQQSLEPVFNPMLRCPLPPVAVTPDSLRQFYVGSQIPQMRLLTPPTNISGSGSGNTTVNQTTVVNNNTSGGGSSTSASIKAKTVSITTSTMNPGDIFSGSFQVSKSFQLLSLGVSSTCEVRLYGTAAAQSTDASRTQDAAPAAGVIQNLISDVIFDAAPFTWSYQNRVGSNADAAQNSTVYITIINLDTASDIITATLTYVPLENA